MSEGVSVCLALRYLQTLAHDHFGGEGFGRKGKFHAAAAFPSLVSRKCPHRDMFFFGGFSKQNRSFMYYYNTFSSSQSVKSVSHAKFFIPPPNAGKFVRLNDSNFQGGRKKESTSSTTTAAPGIHDLFQQLFSHYKIYPYSPPHPLSLISSPLLSPLSSAYSHTRTHPYQTKPYYSTILVHHS